MPILDMLQRILSICIIMTMQWNICQASCAPTSMEPGCHSCWKEEYRNSLENLNYLPSRRLMQPVSQDRLNQLGLFEPKKSPSRVVSEHRKKREEPSNGTVTETPGASKSNSNGENVEPNTAGSSSSGNSDEGPGAAAKPTSCSQDRKSSKVIQRVFEKYNDWCYFLTEQLQGFRAYIECEREGGELAPVESDEESQMVRRFVHNTTSGEDVYVYISHEEENLYGARQFNAKEVAFKHSVCSWVGCQCIAFRLKTGSFHNRICDTQHKALCRRPVDQGEDMTADLEQEDRKLAKDALTTEQAPRLTTPIYPPAGSAGQPALWTLLQVVVWSAAALLVRS